MSVDAVTRLTRLAVALRLHDADVAQVLEAVASAPLDSDVLVGASAHGSRFDIVIPDHPAAAAHDGRGLRLRVEGGAVTRAVLRPGRLAPRAAVDALAQPAVREAWLDLVDQLCGAGDGAILGCTAWDDGRAAIDIRYPPRDAQADMMLVLGLDQLAEDTGVSAPQRKLFGRVHGELGGGRELVVATGCTPESVSRGLSLIYPVTAWQTAVRLAEGTTLDAAEAAEIPTRLGALAGALDSDALQSLELALGPHEPCDVVVWVKLSPRR